MRYKKKWAGLAASWTPMGTLIPAPGFCDEIQNLYGAKDLSQGTGDLDEDGEY